MPHSAKAFVGPVLLVASATMLALLWGLSWAAGDFPDCGQMTHSLGDAGWVVGGMLLGAVIGIAIPTILALRRQFVLAIPVLLAAGLGMLMAGDAGAAFAAGQAGCEVWGDLADAGEATLFGLAVGAVPTLLIVGVAVAIGWLFRPRT
jgi:hypothetical protein